MKCTRFVIVLLYYYSCEKSSLSAVSMYGRTLKGFLASQLVLFFGSATIEERICPERNASVCNVLLTSTVSLRSIFLLLTTSTHRILRPLCRSLVSALYERSRGLTSSGRAWALPRVKLSSCQALFPRSLVSIDFSKCTRC